MESRYGDHLGSDGRGHRYNGVRYRIATSMKVTRIDTKLVSIPLKTKYVFASHVADAFRNVLVWIETDAGLTGIGEASFSGRGGGVYAETPESAKVHIDAYLAPAILGEDPFDI